MFLLIDIVAAFVVSAKTKRKKKKNQMKQMHWKAYLVYLVNTPILNKT